MAMTFLTELDLLGSETEKLRTASVTHGCPKAAGGLLPQLQGLGQDWSLAGPALSRWGCNAGFMGIFGLILFSGLPLEIGSKPVDLSRVFATPEWGRVGCQ